MIVPIASAGSTHLQTARFVFEFIWAPVQGLPPIGSTSHRPRQSHSGSESRSRTSRRRRRRGWSGRRGWSHRSRIERQVVEPQRAAVDTADSTSESDEKTDRAATGYACSQTVEPPQTGGFAANSARQHLLLLRREGVPVPTEEELAALEGEVECAIEMYGEEDAVRELLQQAVTVDAESERAGADSMLRAALAIARVHPEQCFAGSGDGDDDDEGGLVTCAPSLKLACDTPAGHNLKHLLTGYAQTAAGMLAQQACAYLRGAASRAAAGKRQRLGAAAGEGVDVEVPECADGVRGDLSLSLMEQKTPREATTETSRATRRRAPLGGAPPLASPLSPSLSLACVPGPASCLPRACRCRALVSVAVRAACAGRRYDGYPVMQARFRVSSVGVSCIECRCIEYRGPVALGLVRRATLVSESNDSPSKVSKGSRQ